MLKIRCSSSNRKKFGNKFFATDICGTLPFQSHIKSPPPPKGSCMFISYFLGQRSHFLATLGLIIFLSARKWDCNTKVAKKIVKYGTWSTSHKNKIFISQPQWGKKIFRISRALQMARSRNLIFAKLICFFWNQKREKFYNSA